MIFRCMNKTGIAALCLLFLVNAAKAQQIDEALLKRIADKFIKSRRLKLEKIQEAPATTSAAKPPAVFRTRCYGDKEYMMVVAVYSHKPSRQSARMFGF